MKTFSTYWMQLNKNLIFIITLELELRPYQAHQVIFITVNCIEKMEIKKKRQQMAQQKSF